MLWTPTLSAKSDRGVPLLVAQAVVAGYGGAPILNGIDIQVSAGEIVSVVGPNGSGKSTLLKALVGIVTVTSGSVTLNTVDVTGHTPNAMARAGVGYVPQVDDVFNPLTVKENLEVGGYLLPRRDISSRIDDAIDAFPPLGKMMTRRAGKLSGGERKMLAMARVLMLRPRLFVLDEPTANLAPKVADSLLREQVGGLAATGAAVLLVEQRARTALAISDFAYVLAGGTCQMKGPPTQLANSPEFVHSFLGGKSSLQT